MQTCSSVLSELWPVGNHSSESCKDNDSEEQKLTKGVKLDRSHPKTHSEALGVTEDSLAIEFVRIEFGNV